MFHSYASSEGLLKAFYVMEKTRKIGLRALVVGAAILPLALACLATPAKAACNTIPQRYAALCVILGYEDTDCEVKFARGEEHKATLTIVVDDAVGEPDVPHFVEGAYATTLIIETKRGTVSQIYQSSEGDELLGLARAMQRPPCLTAEQYEARDADAAHVCLSEEDFPNTERILNKLIWEHPDKKISERLRRLFGEEGLPVVTSIEGKRVRSQLDAHTGLASLWKVRGGFRFALPQ